MKKKIKASDLKNFTDAQLDKVLQDIFAKSVRRPLRIRRVVYRDGWINYIDQKGRWVASASWETAVAISKCAAKWRRKK